jgi:uncharacterized protein
MGTVDELRRQSGLPDSTSQETSDRSSLVAELREQLPVILEDEPVRLAYLHGSHITGQTTPLSDVDVALVVGDAIDPLARLKLILRVQLALADRCGIENADVQVIDGAPLVFRGRVVSEGVLVYSRDEKERIAFEVKTRMRYFDYLPIHRELQASFFRDIRERGLHG